MTEAKVVERAGNAGLVILALLSILFGLSFLVSTLFGLALLRQSPYDDVFCARCGTKIG